MPNPSGRGQPGGGECAHHKVKQPKRKSAQVTLPEYSQKPFGTELNVPSGRRARGPLWQTGSRARPVAVGEPPGLSVPQFPCLSNGNASTHLTGLLRC